MTASVTLQAILSDRAASVGGPTLGSLSETDARTRPPSIVLILTDDQRWDTLRYMPTVRRKLVRHGVTFENGYVVNPVCCPSRATIATGQYSHGTGVYTNHPNEPHGGFPSFDDTSTIATWLDAAGYRTALIGKYLNGYRSEYVPPGWDRWFASFGESGYFDYQASVDGRIVEFGSDADEYGTDVLAARAVSFIVNTPPEVPLFLHFAPHAPHEPAIPAPGDRNAFGSIPVWRPGGYDESAVDDKPAWVQALDRLEAGEQEEIDRFRERQIRSLPAVDRAVGRIVRALRKAGRLRDTLIVFTSDNGMLWGEHRLVGKGVPYEEALRVPFVVRYDRLIDRARTDRNLVLNLDLAPTFASVADVDAPEAEGLDMSPLLAARDAAWRSTFLIEHLSLSGAGAPTFCAAHTRSHVLIAYGTGEREFYDLGRDPLQLENVAGRARYGDLERELMGRLRELCQPAPPGYELRSLVTGASVNE